MFLANKDVLCHIAPGPPLRAPELFIIRASSSLTSIKTISASCPKQLATYYSRISRTSCPCGSSSSASKSLVLYSLLTSGPSLIGAFKQTKLY
ncbi:hypothetical protein LSUE1_G009056 [Lachnellula suecica]|uniref:Uncharacterized protein n=1 Tax=Lachnellula suecica TaxID=602035 RepID=A0A8T9BRD3_9HELO|nr:hypothetical protein LSUE1_G009056 [Lachnellula suecica]